MKIFSLILLAGISVSALVSCNQLNPDTEFGAYYTKMQSDEGFEQFSRTGDFPDIIVELGTKNGMLVFWRGSSYLPYWETAKGDQYNFSEIVPRSGNGDDVMPDRVNTYSHTKIIESNPDSVLIHWRYLRSFETGNPDQGVSPAGFVDEYFTIYPNGEILRRVRPGQAKSDDWNNKGNLISQEITLLKRGLEESELIHSEMLLNPLVANGADIVEKLPVIPVIGFKFDEGIGESVKESVSNREIDVSGRKVLWRKGVSGTCLQFDGYNTEVRIPASGNLDIKNEISLQAFVSIGAYPWSWCPIIQQCDDVPEEVAVSRKHGNYSVEIQKEIDTGFFLGINGDGNPGFKLRVGDNWEELKTDYVLERRHWYLITSIYSHTSGLMKIYVDDRLVGEKRIKKR